MKNEDIYKYLKAAIIREGSCYDIDEYFCRKHHIRYIECSDCPLEEKCDRNIKQEWVKNYEKYLNLRDIMNSL